MRELLPILIISSIIVGVIILFAFVTPKISWFFDVERQPRKRQKKGRRIPTPAHYSKKYRFNDDDDGIYYDDPEL